MIRKEAAIDVQLRPAVVAGEARLMHVRRAAIEAEDVGLQRAEPLLAHRAGERPEVVERADRRLAHRVGMAHAIGAAVRPVEPQPLAHRAVQKLGDRHAQRSRLDVDQRVLDRRDRLLDQPARRLAGERVQHRRDALDRPRVHADQVLGEPADDRAQPLAAVALVVLGPADHAVVGGDLEERPDAPAGIAVQVLDLRDSHEPSLPSFRSTIGFTPADRSARGAVRLRRQSL